MHRCFEWRLERPCWGRKTPATFSLRSRSFKRLSTWSATTPSRGTSWHKPMHGRVRPRERSWRLLSGTSLFTHSRKQSSSPGARSASCHKARRIGSVPATSSPLQRRSRLNKEAGELMDWKSTLKLAAGGAVLFVLGAFATAVAIGRVPVSVGVWANRTQIEQVVQEYLLNHPEIIIQMSNKLDSQQAAA